MATTPSPKSAIIKNRSETNLHELRWSVLPEFVARLMVCKSHLSLGPQLEKFLADPTAKSILKRVEAAIALELDEIDVRGPLDDRIADFWNTFSSKSDDWTLKHPFVRHMATDATQSLCRQCAPDAPCQGTESSSLEDRKTLTARGHCIIGLLAIIKCSEELTDELYKLHAPGIAPIPISFIASYLRAPNPKLKMSIDGSTIQRSSSRFVKIGFHTGAFGWQDYVAVLPIAFHEYFVHGRCGIDISAPDAVLAESFDEGWMDWVGLILLEEWLQNLPDTAPEFLRANSDRFESIATKLNLSRFDDTLNADAPVWQTGVRAGRIVRNIAQTAMGSKCAGDKVFFAFSLGLNSSELSGYCRQELVDKLNSIGSLDNRAIDLQRRLDLLAHWEEFGIWLQDDSRGQGSVSKYATRLASELIEFEICQPNEQQMALESVG